MVFAALLANHNPNPNNKMITINSIDISA